jgi:hypothetical protein
MPHSSKVSAPSISPTIPGSICATSSALRRACSLPRFSVLVLVVGLEEALHEVDPHPRIAPALDGHEEGNAEQQVRRDGLDVARIAAALLGDGRVAT